MRTLILSPLIALFMAVSHSGPPDLPGLAVAIIEVARQDAGLGPGATHPR